MSSIIIFGIIAAFLFGGAFLTKRRIGVLGLALAGGFLFAELWGTAVGLLFASQGLGLGTLSPEVLALVVVTLLPASILLFHGPSYQHGSFMRFWSPILFTLFALALTINSLQPLLTSSGAGISIYRTLASYRELIITAGLMASFVDIFLTKPSKHGKPGPKH